MIEVLDDEKSLLIGCDFRGEKSSSERGITLGDMTSLVLSGGDSLILSGGDSLVLSGDGVVNLLSGEITKGKAVGQSLVCLSHAHFNLVGEEYSKSSLVLSTGLE